VTAPAADPLRLGSDELLQAVMAASFVLGIDPSGRIVLASSGAERLLGYPDGTLAGRSVAEVLRDGTSFADLAAGAEADRMRTLTRGDGTPVQVLLSVASVRSEAGVVTAAVLVASEVPGERRAADALRRAFEREHAAADRLRELGRIKDDFVANVSHELRTPLTTVVGNTEMLLDGDAGELTGPQRRLLSAIERNARRLGTLVGDLLMLSRMQSGKINMSVHRVVLQEVIERALTDAAEQRAASAVHLTVDVAREPLVVDGDAEDLARMVGNVLGNALKFTPADGSVWLRVAADGRYARVDVTDTGIGIPAEEMGLVFDGFFRSSRSQRAESPGTGLGLTIARSIADRHAGTIELRRNEPEGTAVSIRIPLTQP
jgi:PAS domain S-box-containing protein